MLYEDFVGYVVFDGILFYDDVLFLDYEDVSVSVITVY